MYYTFTYFIYIYNIQNHSAAYQVLCFSCLCESMVLLLYLCLLSTVLLLAVFMWYCGRTSVRFSVCNIFPKLILCPLTKKTCGSEAKNCLLIQLLCFDIMSTDKKSLRICCKKLSVQVEVLVFSASVVHGC